ncbi:MAG: ADP-ribosyl-(dinitrogen reductase) glycohydrolase [bacterium ADurb.Bin243]|nr:MAG: ADP-ribosyl-(dinitrogen reductase) glycohydrolase [bacterium ADurb.Bin243]
MNEENSINLKESIAGCILGTAAGDSLGLLYENLTPERQARLYKGAYEQRFFFSKGFISDDTEHTIMLAAALIESGLDPGLFPAGFARQLKRWIFTMPAGVGFATLRSCLKLVAGFPPDKSGVFSAGNGPCMRSALLGVLFGGNPEKMKLFVKASSAITHTDKKAENAALAIALAAHMSSCRKDVSPAGYFSEIEKSLPAETEFLNLIKNAVNSVERGETTREFLQKNSMGGGVSGYSYHTAPAVIHCWLKNQADFQGGVSSIISCGGDTDTTAAITGAIIGARVHKSGIPSKWLENIASWPYTIEFMSGLAEILSEAAAEKENNGINKTAAPVNIKKISRKNIEKPITLCFLRNTAAVAAILFHALRRALPPY